MNHSSALSQLLHALTYNPHAQMQSCLVPYGGIYWEDELPDRKTLHTLPQHEYLYPFRILAIRKKIWVQEALSQEECMHWELAKAHYPNWPIFYRLHVTEEQYQAQMACEQGEMEFFKALVAEADDFSFAETEAGNMAWSATFHLDTNSSARTNHLLRHMKRWVHALQHILQNIFRFFL